MNIYRAVAVSLWLVCASMPLNAQTEQGSSDTLSQQVVAADAQDSYQFDSEAQRQTFLSLTAELRCPMCQNQNIADSDAMIAHDMRRKVYQLIQQGNSEQQVIDFMKSRYGDFVHYKPPLTAYTMWLWLLPVVFAVTALFFISRKPKAVDQGDVASKLAQAEELLKREG